MGNTSWTDDPRGPSNSVIPDKNGIYDLGSPSQQFRNLYISGTIFGGVGGLVGAISGNGSGTVYTFTATLAPLIFGTTNPSLVITTPGTWLIHATVQLSFSGATFASSQNVTLEIFRTNNTPGVIPGSLITIPTGVVTVDTGLLGVIPLPSIIYATANNNDALTIYGNVSVLPSAGTLIAASANIIAQFLHP